MATEKQRNPVRLQLTIEQGSLKKIVEEGRLMEFVDALSALASAQIKSQVIDQLARTGVERAGGGLSISVGFDDDNPYGTIPKPWPWPIGIWEDALREVAMEELTEQLRGRG